MRCEYIGSINISLRLLYLVIYSKTGVCVKNAYILLERQKLFHKTKSICHTVCVVAPSAGGFGIVHGPIAMALRSRSEMT